jgi:hypothetical protein
MGEGAYIGIAGGEEVVVASVAFPGELVGCRRAG